MRYVRFQRFQAYRWKQINLYIFFVVFLPLILRMFELQVTKGCEYTTLKGEETQLLVFLFFLS